MSRPLLFLLLVMAASVAPTRTLGGQQSTDPGPSFQVIARPPRRIEAPADEYFGRYRLSSLSVRNAISDMTIEGTSPLALPLQLGRIEAVRSALPEWADRYPRDPWVPSSIFKFAVFLISKQEPSFGPTALAFLSYLEWAYPHTWYARNSQAAIADLQMSPNVDPLIGPTVGQLALVRDHSFAALGIRRHR